MAYGDTGVVSTGGHGWSAGRLRRGLQSTPVPFNPAVKAYSTPTSMLKCDHGGVFVGSPGLRPKCALAYQIARGDIPLDRLNAATGENFLDAQDAHDNMTIAHVIKWVMSPPAHELQLRYPNRWSPEWTKSRRWMTR